MLWTRKYLFHSFSRRPTITSSYFGWNLESVDDSAENDAKPVFSLSFQSRELLFIIWKEFRKVKMICTAKRDRRFTKEICFETLLVTRGKSPVEPTKKAILNEIQLYHQHTCFPKKNRVLTWDEIWLPNRVCWWWWSWKWMFTILSMYRHVHEEPKILRFHPR